MWGSGIGEVILRDVPESSAQYSSAASAPAEGSSQASVVVL